MAADRWLFRHNEDVALRDSEREHAAFLPLNGTGLGTLRGRRRLHHCRKSLFTTGSARW